MCSSAGVEYWHSQFTGNRPPGALICVDDDESILASGTGSVKVGFVDEQGSGLEVPGFCRYLTETWWRKHIVYPSWTDFQDSNVKLFGTASAIMFGMLPRKDAAEGGHFRELTPQEMESLHAAGMRPPGSPKECAACGITGKPLLVCGKCHMTRYCSRECQKAHWNVHKAMCKRMS